MHLSIVLTVDLRFLAFEWSLHLRPYETEPGPIPDELSQLEDLEQLFLSDNELEGETDSSTQADEGRDQDTGVCPHARVSALEASLVSLSLKQSKNEKKKVYVRFAAAAITTAEATILEGGGRAPLNEANCTLVYPVGTGDEEVATTAIGDGCR